MSTNDSSLTAEKVAQAVQILDELDVDLWLTFARETSMLPDPALGLILGLKITWRSLFLISRTGRHTAIVGHYDADSIERLGIYDVVVGYHHGVRDHLLAALKTYRPARIAINTSQTDVAADGLTLGNYRTLLSYLEGTPYGQRLQSAEGIIAALRGRKTPREVERIRQAVATTEKLFDEVEAFVRPGMTQRQIADFVHGLVDGAGLDYAWDKAHNPIVTCGPNSPVGHAMPGDVPLEPGHTLHLDLGVKQDGYCSDLQRMWYVPEEGETEVPADVQQAFKTVLAAIRAGEEALQVGAPGWRVDSAARKTVIDAGYPEFMHAFGHLLGRSAHDGATVLAPRWEKYAGICELPVEDGNVFTLELHVVVPDRGIMSLEEDVLVTDSGVEYLSTPQRELRLIQS
ncbi:MAG: aminopeptidase P family protein [Chloroflexota bacterium]|nr:MAG: aminopeptidase P family protein [Chloroflexota bacterium]